MLTVAASHGVRAACLLAVSDSEPGAGERIDAESLEAAADPPRPRGLRGARGELTSGALAREPGRAWPRASPPRASVRTSRARAWPRPRTTCRARRPTRRRRRSRRRARPGAARAPRAARRRSRRARPEGGRRARSTPSSTPSRRCATDRTRRVRRSRSAADGRLSAPIAASWACAARSRASKPRCSAPLTSGLSISSCAIRPSTSSPWRLSLARRPSSVLSSVMRLGLSVRRSARAANATAASAP